MEVLKLAEPKFARILDSEALFDESTNRKPASADILAIVELVAAGSGQH